MQESIQLAALQTANIMEIIIACVYIHRCNSTQTGTADAEEDIASILQVSNQLAALQTANITEIIISSVYNFRCVIKQLLMRHKMKSVQILQA